MAHFRRLMRASMVTVVMATLAGPVWALPLMGNSFGGAEPASLYDLDSQTGQADNPRPTSVYRLVGIAMSAQGSVYGLTNSTAPTHPNTLVRIDPATGSTYVVGPTGLTGITEGDLAFDPTSGVLYGLYNLDSGQRQLMTLDTATGSAAPFGSSLPGDPSAMAFDPNGSLYVLDTSLQKLLTVDKTTAAVLTMVDLSVPLGSTAGMAIDPDTGTFYVADGGSGGTNRLYTLDPLTGVLTEIGPTGLAEGLAGLTIVPEPGSWLLAAGAAGLLRRRGRRMHIRS